MPSVRILNGPNKDQVYVLRGGELVGRDPQNAIQVFAPGVSRKHFQFVSDQGQLFVQDLGSSNGTYVNNQRIQRHPLIESDMVTVGGINLRYSHSDDGAVSAMPTLPLGMSSEEVAIGAFGASPAAAAMFGAAPQPLGGHLTPRADAKQSGAVVLKEDDDEGSEADYAVDASIVFKPEVTLAGTKGVEDKVLALQKRLTIMFEISQMLAGSHSIDEMLALVLEKLFSVFPQADRGFILLGDSVEELRPVAVRERNKEPTDKNEVQISRTIARKVCTEKQALLSQNAMEDDRFSGGMSILNFRILSMACAPLLFRDEVFGLIQVDTQDRAKKFTPDDINLLAGIAALAAIFLKNRKEAEARQNLMRYFSPTVASEVANGKIDLKLGGDTKTGTVFFSDIIGFTSMSEGMTAPQVVDKINRYMRYMVDIVFKYNGSVDKFIGDCIMAVWGVPTSMQEEAVAAVTAGVEMQNAVFLFNCELAAEGQNPIHMGIGLNSGPFVAGNMGSERRMEYTVIGDNVNLAQRVESKAGRGMVLCSDTTYDRCSSKVLAVKLKPVPLKGKAKWVGTYVIRGIDQTTPTSSGTVFMTSLPVAVNKWSETCERGLLVKVKPGADGTVLGLVLFARKPAEPRVRLEFYAPELPRFTIDFQIQGDVKIQAPHGCCVKGVFSTKGTPLEELFTKRVVAAEKSPDDMPRGQTPA